MTSVYQADLPCIPMQVRSRNYKSLDELIERQILTFESSDCCTVERNVSGFSGLAAPPAGGWWSNTATSNFPAIANTSPQEINQTQTSECNNREMFFVVSPFYTNQSDQPVESYAQLCSSKYLVADDVTTTFTNTRDSSTVTIDKETFERTKVRLDPSIVDVQAFEAQFLDQAWSAYFQPPGGFNERRPIYGGPFILLATSLAKSGSTGELGSIVDPEAFNREDTLRQARRLKQRFFGEVLQASLVSLGQQNLRMIPSQVTRGMTRLIVAYWISITLGVILLLSGASLGLTLWCSRLRRRPLNLHRDPGSVAAVMSMILEDPTLRERFRGSDKLPEDSMKLLLAGTTCRMIHGRLFVEIDESTRSSRGMCH